MRISSQTTVAACIGMVNEATKQFTGEQCVSHWWLVAAEARIHDGNVEGFGSFLGMPRTLIAQEGNVATRVHSSHAIKDINSLDCSSSIVPMPLFVFSVVELGKKHLQDFVFVCKFLFLNLSHNF